MSDQKAGPLAGLRVLELGQVIAGPFAGALLAWFGADVIKVEPPNGGDPLRTWRQMHGDTSLWWYIMGRNKRCITANLHEAEGRALIKQLAAHCDVLIENFKPGRMEAWGLGPDDLKAVNPRLIMARVSGWGQTGPYAGKPGYASVAEGVGGLRYVTGFPDRPPARANLSLGDTVAGLHTALGILAAVYNRDVRGDRGDANTAGAAGAEGVSPIAGRSDGGDSGESGERGAPDRGTPDRGSGGGSGRGQVVDMALFEGVFNLMESTLPEFATAGVVRERHGSKVTGIVPSNTYRCADGKFIIIGGNGDSIFKRLMTVAGRADMADDPDYARNHDRVRNEAAIDAAISAWTEQHPFDDVLAALEGAGVPAGPIYSVADQMQDPHFQARGLFERVTLDDGDVVTLPRFAPVLSETPGATRWPGPRLGAHNRDIYRDLLGLSDEEIARLTAAGVI